LHRYFLRLSYKGTNYHGWQIQENSDSVQAHVDRCLSDLLSEKIETMGCGRTDTGVHARMFYAHFDCKMKIDLEQLKYKINRILPVDIAVQEVLPVNPDAHTRFDAISRSYQYHISRVKDPFSINRSWYLYGKLEVEKMNEAAAKLITTADFASFAKSGMQVKTTICTVSESRFELVEDLLIFHITANRFLRNMVRAIVGTLVEVGQEKITVNDFEQIIHKKKRAAAGLSAPAGGLYLTNIIYPKELFK
jgi:tRNA pseudouridine38-40 synthase